MACKSTIHLLFRAKILLDLRNAHPSASEVGPFVVRGPVGYRNQLAPDDKPVEWEPRGNVLAREPVLRPNARIGHKRFGARAPFPPLDRPSSSTQLISNV